MKHTFFFLQKSRRSAGFTLIELMITVAIVAILSAIALPMYSDYLIRSKIPGATSNLAAKRMQIEQFFQDNRTYANAPACVSDTASSKDFTFDCAGTYGVAGTAALFTIEAVGKNSMAGFVFTIDQNNLRTTTMVSGAPSGWTGNTACWVVRKGGGC